jgi:hypothetical protein
MKTQNKFLTLALLFISFNAFSQQITTNRNPVGLEHNLLFNATSRYAVTQQGPGVNLNMLFDGAMMPDYSVGAPTPAAPAVILIENLPDVHTQAGAWVGWSTRYWPASKFKIEGYDSYGGNVWRTIADYSTIVYSASDFKVSIPVGGAYRKLKFTFYQGTGDGGKFGLSELFFIHPEATTPYFGLFNSFIPPADNWQINGSNISYTKGNVGIGTTKAAEGRLDINANGNIPIIRGNGSYIPTGLRFIDDSYTQAGQVKEWSIWKGNEWAKGLGFHRYDAVNHCAGGICAVSLFLHDNGNVGVGNSVTPAAQLHVKASGLETPFDAMIVDVASFNTGANAIASSYFKVRDIGAGNLVPFIIRGDGNVGIGTTSPDEKLTVKGKIHAQEVRIDLAGPLSVPDYVFANDYKLKTLNEVETYIKANNHLPEIPSAKEMAQNGMLVSEMNLSLLKKIVTIQLFSKKHSY